jgi:filamentous hemagglutinin family protein
MTGKSWRRSLFLSRVLVTAALLTMATRGHGGAGIATDGSVGARMTIPGVNGVLTIPQALGRVAGNNLFHSFSQFNIDTGQTADFRTNTASLANVISRVTGGSLSQINGTLKLTAAAGSAPAFFFINPAGVVFGAGAAINVPGAFHVSTADHVKFANGDKFYADLGQASTLSSAAPEAFGFLGNTRTSITVKDGARLATTSQPISIVAGDIEINRGNVSTQGGDIRVVALGKVAQDIGFTGALPAASGDLSALNSGRIHSQSAGASDAGSIAVSAGNITIDSGDSYDYTGIFSLAYPGANAGTVNVRAGSIDVDGRGSVRYAAGIFSQAWYGSGNAGSVEVSTRGNLSLVNGGQISADTFSDGIGGKVTVRAGGISIDGQGSIRGGDGYGTTGISSNAYVDSSGNAGIVDVSTAGNIDIRNGGLISADTFSRGNAGPVTVSAGSLRVDGTLNGSSASLIQTGISSSASDGSSGKAGSIAVSATGSLTIVHGGTIASDSTLSQGDASPVKVRAGSIAIDGQGSSNPTGVFSKASLGNAGSVEVSATDQISITNGGEISSRTLQSGDAGPLKVSAGSIAIDGHGNTGGTGIFSLAESYGNAGNVDVSVIGALSIVNGGEISSGTLLFGDAGAVQVSAASIAIGSQGSANASGIASLVAGDTGKAGSVDVSVTGSLVIVHGGKIASESTLSSGDSGPVKVSAGSIAIDGQGSSNPTGVFSKASLGNAGSVEVSAKDQISIANGGEISSRTLQWGDAGPLKVSAGSIAIDGHGNTGGTGIFSLAESYGNAGNVDVAVIGALSIVNDGEISSGTLLSGDAGAVQVSAASIAIGSQGSANASGIASLVAGDTGKAGSVDVSVTGSLVIVHGGKIASESTLSSGDSGPVKVSAGNIVIDGQGGSNVTGIYSQAEGFGNAGNVEVASTGTLSVVGGGKIVSANIFYGAAGTVNVRAGSITLDSQVSSSSTGIYSLADSYFGKAGNVDVVAMGSLSLIGDGKIASINRYQGDAGNVKVSANSIAINGPGRSSQIGIYSQVEGDSGKAGNAGNVDVASTGSLSVDHGGKIASTNLRAGGAGAIKVSAGGIAVDHGSKISSDTGKGFSGNAGSVEVSAARELSLNHGGVISSNTWSTGNAGTLKVCAGNIAIDATGGEQTGILSDANPGSTGHAGSVAVTVTGTLSIVNGGTISSSTLAAGDAGSVTVSADAIAIDGEGSTLTGIRSVTTPSATGNAGSLDVTATGYLSLVHGGEIITDSFSASGKAGTVKVRAGSLAIDSQGKSNPTGIFSQTHLGTGSAGSIDVAVTGTLTIDNGGLISSSTYAAGNAGTVKVSAGDIAIDRRQSSTAPAIVSQSYGSSGDAGSVEVVATGSLFISHGSGISSSSRSSGDAGSVTVRAGSIRVDGLGPYGDPSTISAAAGEGSSGQTGFVSVVANDITLSNGGHISIENKATVPNPSALMPTSISVTAPNLTILNSPNAITTNSTGNVAAGNIKITASEQLFLDPSGITTTSNQGNGGAIDIIAGLLWLQDSQIATSVLGLAGNGGNISIAADSLIMNTGFIQANTAAANASGGLVSITVNNLVASGNTLFLGGNTPYTYQPGAFGFNVIQAAAPTGVSGTVQTSVPRLDVTSSLVGLDTRLINVPVARRLCENTSGSSLVPVGRGGLPPGGADFLSPGQISGIGLVTSPTVSLPTVHANWPMNTFSPCLAAL